MTLAAVPQPGDRAVTVKLADAIALAIDRNNTEARREVEHQRAGIKRARARAKYANDPVYRQKMIEKARARKRALAAME